MTDPTAGVLEAVTGIGTDLVEIDRLARSLARTPRLRERVFSAPEILYCEARGRPAQHYAARFAAKEAFLKALGMGIFEGVALIDVEVAREEEGAPWLRLGASAMRALEKRGCRRALLSLSHCGNLAIAVVLVQ
jgi:holo-[acyl-carrier protein] synthase